MMPGMLDRRSVSSPDLLELAAASDALPHSSGTDAAPPAADAAASPDPKTVWQSLFC